MEACVRGEACYRSGAVEVPELGVSAGWCGLSEGDEAAPFVWNEDGTVGLLIFGKVHAERRSIETPVAHQGRGPELAWRDYVVRLYEKEGDLFLAKLNGLFSGLLVDKAQGKAVLFNDRYGVNRLYLTETAQGFSFANEAKALLRVLPQTREFDLQGVAQFFSFGFTAGTRTLFKGVQTLLGGSAWFFNANGAQLRTYFSPAEWESQPALSTGEFTDELAAVMSRVTPRSCAFDHAIGISLTAGLDTRMVMACLPELRKTPVCYTYAGPRGESMDARIAAQVAKACGFEHHLLRITPDFFTNFGQHVDRGVCATDGTFGPTGSHEVFLSEKARALSAARLTGNYGGEVLRGVSTFKPLGLARNMFDPGFKAQIDGAERELLEIKAHPVTFSAFKEIPWNLHGCLAAGRSQLDFRTPYLDNELVALAYRAPQALRRSREPGLQLVRSKSPILAAIATDKGDLGGDQALAKKVRMAWSKATFKLDYLNNEGLPHALSPFEPAFRFMNRSLGLIGLHKHLHYRSWFRGELTVFLQERMSAVAAIESPFWSKKFAAGMAEEHISGRKNYVQEINAVLTLEAVERLFFKQPAQN